MSEEISKTTQAESGEAERLRGASGFFGWYFGPFGVFAVRTTSFTLFSERKMEGSRPGKALRPGPHNPRHLKAYTATTEC